MSRRAFLQSFEKYLDQNFPGWYDMKEDASNTHESKEACCVHGASCRKFTTPKWLYCAKALALTNKLCELEKILPRSAKPRVCNICGQQLESNDFGVQLHQPDNGYINPTCISCDFSVG